MNFPLRAIRFTIGVFLPLLITGCSPAANTSSAVPVAALQAANGYPVTVTNTDAAGKSMAYTYQSPPSRVIITHPGATELLLELGLEDHILATVAPYGAPLDDIAEKYKKLPLLKARYSPSQEELLLMQPDLIMGWKHQFISNELGETAAWQKRGTGTFIIPDTINRQEPTLENTVYDYIHDIGVIFGVRQRADDYIQKLKTRIDNVAETVKDVRQKKTVLILQSYGNGKFSLYDKSYLISTLVDKAGGVNLSENRASFVGAEKVLAFDPDFIIFVSYDTADSSHDITDEKALAQVQSLTELRHMRAIQAGNIINLPYFTVNNGGVRVAGAIEKIARQLYPDRF